MGRSLEYADPETGEQKVADFTGVGDIDAARQQYAFERETAPMVAQDLLALGEEYGPQYVAQRRRELQQSDPEGFEARQQLGQELLSTRMADTELPAAPVVDPLSEGAMTGELRRQMEEGVIDNLSRSMLPSLLKKTQRAQRQRGAAKSNILGNAAALRESLAVQLAEEGRDQQAWGAGLALLQSGQSTGDTANRMRQANLAMGTAGFQNQMQRTGFGQQMAQQDISNLQGYAFGQPLAAQFGMMQGAQRGASPYAPLTPVGGMGFQQMYGQNAQLMGSNYGTGAGIYNTQMQNQPENPWMQGLGFAAAAYGGPMLGRMGYNAGG
jgi:hypothetical protein